MHVYEFTLTLDIEPDLDTTDRLYGHFGSNGPAPLEVEDFTITIQAGAPIVSCTIMATSFDEALQLVLPELKQEGLHVLRAEVDEAGLALLQETA